MDAHALLSSQGWRGHGHSLHKTDDGIGLSKPLLISRKDNTKGLGQKQHFTSDQWWMNAFDEQLQGLDTSKKGEVKQTVLNGKLNAIEKGSLGKYALYTSFVRGGFLEGTVSLESEQGSSDSSNDEPSTGASSSTPTPNNEPLKPKEESKEERRQRREAKRARKEQRARVRQEKAKSKKVKKTKSEIEVKAQRRARKEEKRRQRKENARGES